MSNRDEIRSAMQEMMNDVMNRGYDLLLQKPEQSEELEKVLSQASESLSEQLTEFDQVKTTAPEYEMEERYEILSQRAQERNLELLSALQRISRGQSAFA
jgi:hypothetical protein